MTAPGIMAPIFAAPAGGGSFDPSTLGLHLWLDSTDASTLFEDEAHTDAAENADIVKAILNKGSAGGYWTEATNGPTYNASGGTVNGPHLKFDGTNDKLTGSALSAYITAAEGDFLFAGCVNAITTDQNDGLIYLNDTLFADVDGWAELHVRQSVNRMRSYAYDTAARIASAAYTENTAFVAHWRVSGGVHSLSVNAGSPGTVACGDIGDLSQALRIGCNYNATVFTEKEFVGLMGRKTILDATELANAMTWLGAKVGLTL